MRSLAKNLFALGSNPRKPDAEARRANEIAQITADRQLRPYIHFADIDKPNHKLKLERGEKLLFRFQNFGQTPAENVCINWAWDIFKRPVGDRVVTLAGEPECYGKIAPGQKVDDNLEIDILPIEIGKIAAGELLLLRMIITYEWAGGTQTDCHDLTWLISSNGRGDWKSGQISKTERERTE